MFDNWLQRAVWNNHCGPEWLGSHTTKNFLSILCWRFSVHILLHKMFLRLKTLFFSVQTFLRQILNGTKSSERHMIYTSGRVSEKDNLKHRAGFGPIADDNLVCREYDILFTDLLFSLSRSSSVRRKIKTVRISSIKLSLLSGHLY